MKLSNILNLVLAIALVFTSYELAIAPHSEAKNGVGANGQAVIDNIMTRTSIRAYTKDTISKEQIDQLLRAGMAAPSAANKQPWHFVVVTDRQLLKDLGNSSNNWKMTAEAPLAIVVCGDLTKALDNDGRDMWIEDTSAATENILLAAHGLGLGAVWTGVYPIQEREDAVAKLLNLPDNLVPMATVVVGHPAESPAPKDKYKTENITFNKFKGE